MNDYELKQEARRERILARADRLRSEGQARYKSGMDRLKAIPFGQPILVGHYSEKRDRNYRRKACAAVDKGFELMNAAREAEARAAAVGSGGVSSDDPDAVQKLEAQLDGLKAKQAMMVESNKELRKKAGPQWREAQRQGLGYASWQLSNNSSNIRRIEQRIEQLKQNANRETKSEDYQGFVKLVENAEANRVQLIFPGKPSAEIREKLKKSGYRWSPSEGAWQRHLSNSAVYWAKELIKEIVKAAEG